jgi:hypothetical protein
MRRERNGREGENEEQVDGRTRPAGHCRQHSKDQHVRVVPALRQVGKVLPERPAEIRVRVAAVLAETSGQHQVEVGIASRAQGSPRCPPEPQMNRDDRIVPSATRVASRPPSASAVAGGRVAPRDGN